MAATAANIVLYAVTDCAESTLQRDGRRDGVAHRVVTKTGVWLSIQHLDVAILDSVVVWHPCVTHRGLLHTYIPEADLCAAHWARVMQVGEAAVETGSLVSSFTYLPFLSCPL